MNEVTTRQVIITGERKAELQTFQLDANLPPRGLLIETERSFISTGTELSIFSGVDKRASQPGTWFTFPWKPGYANIGHVRAAGAGVRNTQVGERVFTFGPHASWFLYSDENAVVPVPEQLDSSVAAASRMAGVAITALHLAAHSDNRSVAIFGLGLVGNLLAQLCQINGCRVIGIDLSPARRELARSCGIEDVRDHADGVAANMAVDAVGDLRVILQCLKVCKSYGDVILLGTPRTEFPGSLRDVFAEVMERKITIKGAHEWRLPHYSEIGWETSHFSKQVAIFDWMLRGKLQVQPLISHHTDPAEIQQTYENLLNKKDEYTGVVLDWR